MASYADVGSMAQQAPFAVDPSVQYPPMPIQQPNVNYSENPPPGVVPTPNPQPGPTSAVRPRLRKACDACSLRKVKCDESQPCRPCSSLNLPCKFERPSRRRGPPNRHAESLKRQKLDPSGQSGPSGPSSPTHAAQTLASFAQQQVLSIEAIALPTVVSPLIDDYFTYLHPMIPIPHEPSFREYLDRRDDLKDPRILALIASMLASVVAALPRRSRHYLRTQNMSSGPLTPGLFVERCHSIATQAREANYLDRDIVPLDAMISYLMGMTAAFTSFWGRARIYIEQALTMSRICGLHKPNGPEYVEVDGSASLAHTADGHDLPDPNGQQDCIRQELGRRTFWLIFMAIRRLQQIGMPAEEMNILPAGRSRSYPPLPMEVDDRYIMQDQVLPQPQGTVSELLGFNANIRVYLSYNKLSIVEIADYANEMPTEQIRKRLLEQSLRSIKRAFENLPTDLTFSFGPRMEKPHTESNYPPPKQDVLEPQQAEYPNGELQDPYSERRRAQLEVQRADLAATQLVSRFYIVDKYSSIITTSESQNLGEAQEGSGVAELNIVTEQEDITRSFVALLGTLGQYSMEYYGTAFIRKLQDLASLLLHAPRTRKGTFGVQADELLHAFHELVRNLDYLNPDGQVGASIEDDEDAQMRHWAVFGNYQARFARAGALETDV